MLETWVLAIGLVLVLEGIGPFAFPGSWRKMFETIASMTDGQLRFFGLAFLLIGLALVVAARNFF